MLCEELQKLCEFLPVKPAVLVEVELLEDAEEDRCISVLRSNQLETNHPERKSRAGFKVSWEKQRDSILWPSTA